MAIDITNLKGNDLLNALLSKETLTSTDTSPAESAFFKHTEFEKWTQEALVLIEHWTICACGREWATPNTHIMLRETNVKHGMHMKALPHEPPVTHQFPNLQVELEKHFYYCQGCRECLPINPATHVREVQHGNSKE